MAVRAGDPLRRISGASLPPRAPYCDTTTPYETIEYFRYCDTCDTISHKGLCKIGVSIGSIPMVLNSVSDYSQLAIIKALLGARTERTSAQIAMI